MSEEQRTEELKYIEEKLLSIIQIINEPRLGRDDLYERIGQIYAKAEFALDRVKRLKDET